MIQIVLNKDMIRCLTHENKPIGMIWDIQKVNVLELSNKQHILALLPMIRNEYELEQKRAEYNNIRMYLPLKRNYILKQGAYVNSPSGVICENELTVHLIHNLSDDSTESKYNEGMDFFSRHTVDRAKPLEISNLMPIALTVEGASKEMLRAVYPNLNKNLASAMNKYVIHIFTEEDMKTIGHTVTGKTNSRLRVIYTGTFDEVGGCCILSSSELSSFYTDMRMNNRSLETRTSSVLNEGEVKPFDNFLLCEHDFNVLVGNAHSYYSNRIPRRYFNILDTSTSSLLPISP